MVSFVVWIR